MTSSGGDEERDVRGGGAWIQNGAGPVPGSLCKNVASGSQNAVICRRNNVGPRPPLARPVDKSESFPDPPSLNPTFNYRSPLRPPAPPRRDPRPLRRHSHSITSTYSIHLRPFSMLARLAHFICSHYCRRAAPQRCRRDTYSRGNIYKICFQ